MVDGDAFWLPVGSCSVAAALHTPPTAPGTGVLVLPPFGWEEAAAHRALRQWAQQLSAAGHIALRLDWPGTGDSSGLRPDGLAGWTRTVSVAVDHVRRVAGCRRVVALGLGLGGLVAAAACGQGADIDDLVLWAAPPHGRAALRQLRGASALLAQGGAQTDEHGDLCVFGYPLPAALRDDLTDLVICEGDLARPGRRVLGLDAAGRGSLLERFGQAGAAVQVHPTPAYEVLVGHPQTSRLPEQVVERVNAWISDAGVDGSSLPTAASEEVKTTWVSPTGFTEELVQLPGCAGGLSAVITRPVQPSPSPLTVLLYNAGATRRTGPNRMWVDAARRWAEAGVAVVRFDLSGFGDTGPGLTPLDTEAFYADELVDQVRAVIDGLAEVGLPDRVMLAGLCSGAYSTWHTAVDDPRVVGAVLLNPKVLYALPMLMAARASQDLRKLSSGHTWRKLFAGKMELRQLAAVARAALVRVRRPGTFRRQRAQARQALHRDLARLVERGARVATLFVPGETLLLELRATGELKTLAQPPLLTVHVLDGAEGDHTLAAPGLRAQADAVLDAVVHDLSKG